MADIDVELFKARDLPVTDVVMTANQPICLKEIEKQLQAKHEDL